MAIIWDMDGVIADTQRIHAHIESQLLAALGITISPEEITRRFSGMSLKAQFETLFCEAGLPCPYTPEMSDQKARMFEACADEFMPIEGTIACIETYHRHVPFAIASASRPSIIELVLGRLKIRDRFKAITSSREVQNGKPAPDVFLLAAARLGVPPGLCTVVEDGVSGMLGARAAGMRCIALVPEGKIGCPHEYPADLVVSDVRHVPPHWFV